ncbi:MAG: hypothetical protein PHV68_00615 [Candidatus Gastranaerophilales bacterium]|nr:hypothetical protein [Candidatus Gastranaerophilales bacterium]
MKIDFSSKNISVFKWNTPQKTSHQNPFLPNFKGELKTDVFQKAEQNSALSTKDSIQNSLNSIKESMNKTFAPVVSFAGKIGNRANDLWQKANSVNIEKISFTGLFKKNNEVQNLMNKPVNELSEMLESKLSTLEA